MSKTLLRSAGLALAGIVLLGLLGSWLWGPGAVYRWQAAQQNLRDWLRNAEPYKSRTTALDGQVQAAVKETRALAEQVGQLQAEMHSVQQRIERLREAQQQTALLLGQLRERLVRCSTEGTISIHGRTFYRSDLEHEAALLLDRYDAHEQQIADQQAYRASLGQRRQRLQSELRERISRLRALERGQQQVAHWLQERTFLEALAAAEPRYGEARALTGAERDLDELVGNLKRDVLAARLGQELLDGGSISVAEAIRLEQSPSLEARIDQALAPAQE